ncbi:MAG TPA: M48 family metalloprotease [Burkholderiales bacterium]|jgi:predicted Zn-dependent protease
MKACVALALSLYSIAGFAQAAYPEPEAAAAWQGLAASYVRKALNDRTLVADPVLNARADHVMAVIGGAVAAIDARFDKDAWKAILIEDFGHGAAAFPGETILVDAKFLRALQINDDELALILAHEAAHVVASHASAKLAFMAESLGKEKLPTARTALLEFLAKDSYAAAFQPAARLQEREADAIGAAIFFIAGFDAGRALGLFDKLAALEAREDARTFDSHDAAQARKRAVAGMFADLQRLHANRATAVP